MEYLTHKHQKLRRKGALPIRPPSQPCFLPFPFAGTSIVNTHVEFRFRKLTLRGRPRDLSANPICHYHSPALPLLTHIRHSASATHFAEEAA